MKIPAGTLVVVAALAAVPAVAQEREGTYSSWLRTAMGLPKATQEARVLGVPETDIRTILDAARTRRVPAGVITEVIQVGNESIREHGPVDNFGAFVQARLDQGLRGRDLAAAIRAEHAAHGKGKGHAQGVGDAGRGAGKSPAAGKGVGKSAGTGGKPESPGKSGDKTTDKKGGRG